MKNPFIRGERTYLRALEAEDAAALARWFNDAEVIRATRAWRPMTTAAETEYLEKMGRSEKDLALGISLLDDRLIGATGLHQIDPRNRSAMFGIVIGEKDEWGHGYGTEVTRLVAAHGFATLNLHRIWLEVFADNLRGIRAYENAGFVREGVLRQSDWRDGRWHDTVLMSLLSDEWRARAAVPKRRRRPLR